MATYIFPEDRLSFSFAAGYPLMPSSGRTLGVFLDQACTQPATITDLGGTPISSTITVGSDSLIPRFRGPDGVRVLYLTGGYAISPEITTPPITFSTTPPSNPQVNDMWIATP